MNFLFGTIKSLRGIRGLFVLSCGLLPEGLSAQQFGRWTQPEDLPTPRRGMVEKAQESRELIESMDYQAFLELLAFLSSGEFMFYFLVVMGYLFWRKR